MKTRAYCKVNLALDVLGVLDNGYHKLKTIMVPLNLYDEIELSVNEKMEYFCQKRGIYFDENNTIVKAINLMKEEFGIKDNFKVTLKKEIPIKAGLAGGSTDGAAIIRLMNKMYDLKLDKYKIKELCLKIGADVLFCYYNHPALVEGIGNKLRFIDIGHEYHVLIAKPREGVSTKECYELLDTNNCVHPNIDEILDRLRKGEEIGELIKNSLEEPAIKLCSGILEAKNSLLEAGADYVLVSGSGSSVFTISNSEEKIKEIKRNFNNRNLYLRKTKVINY